MRNRLTRITTRGGDQGQSGLADGSRHPKNAPQFEALGDVDELNCAVGIVVAHIPEDHELTEHLLSLQSRLFDLGGALAMPGTEISLADETAELERLVFETNARLGPLANFVLPGGSVAGAHMHLARAICRRAERSVWRLLATCPDDYDVSVGVYLNRLSDALFVLARLLNVGATERLWQQRNHDRTTESPDD